MPKVEIVKQTPSLESRNELDWHLEFRKCGPSYKLYTVYMKQFGSSIPRSAAAS
jgi:hypothetical protein